MAAMAHTRECAVHALMDVWGDAIILVELLAMVLAEAQLQLLQTLYPKLNVIVVNMNVISIKTIQLKATNNIWKEN